MTPIVQKYSNMKTQERILYTISNWSGSDKCLLLTASVNEFSM